MRLKNCCWTLFMLTVCHATITYWEAFYLISETRHWKWQRACIWDQVCGDEYWWEVLSLSLRLIFVVFFLHLSGFNAKLSFIEDSLARYALTISSHTNTVHKLLSLTDWLFFNPILFRYQSRPFPLTSVEDVNQWVENATNGQISNFLESIPHDVVLVLINAMYFKGEPFHQYEVHQKNTSFIKS